MWAINNATGKPSKSTDGGNTWSDVIQLDTNGTAYFLYTDASFATNFIVCSTSDGSGNNNAVYLSKDGGTSWNYVTSFSPGSGPSGALELVVSGLFTQRHHTSGSQPARASCIRPTIIPRSFSLLTGVPWNLSTEALSSVAISQPGRTTRFGLSSRPWTRTSSTAGNAFSWSPYAKNVYMSDFTVSTNTQGAWTNITSRLGGKLEGFAAMAQGNISTIYLAGEQPVGGATGLPPSVLKSTDGGQTWTETFNYANNANVATDQFGDSGSEFNYWWVGYACSLQVCPNDVNLVIISSMGTAWMTTDGGQGGLNTSVATADWKDITVAPAYLHNPGTVAARGNDSLCGNGRQHGRQ